MATLKGSGEASFATGAVVAAATTDLGAMVEWRAGISTGVATISSFGTGANKMRWVRAGAPFTITHGGGAGGILCPGSRDLPVLTGDLFFCTSTAAGAWRIDQFMRANGAPPRALRGFIDGLKLSNNSTTPNTKVDVAAGSATSEAGEVLIENTAVKTVDFGVVGANGLDAGTIASSTTYHLFLIMKGDYTVAALASTSLTPTLPTDYLYKRRIGSVITDGSSVIRPFLQTGDDFFLATHVSDAAATAITTSASLIALTVPAGIKVRPHIRLGSTGGPNLILTDPDQTDLAPTNNLNAAPGYDQTGTQSAFSPALYTNTSRQVRVRGFVSGGVNIITKGWTDPRGRNL